MEDVILSFNWQNIFTVWVMIVILALVFVVGSQLFRKVSGASNDQ